jgi:dihydroorotate dehydrogenase electron transfer subunit
MGVAPLFFLAESLMGRGVSLRFLLGAKTKEQLVCGSQLRSLGAHLLVSTEDGSEGFSGLVTQLLEKLLRQEKFDPRATFVCSAGPEPMLTQVASLARQFKILGQISMERQMGCGVGACLGCVVLCRAQGGRREYRRVCVDGPVFGLQEVVWER